MAGVSSSLCEDQFLCSICLEVFTDPVTTPCGHSFCSICINKHWDNSVHCSCPVCMQDFRQRPQMKVNIALATMLSYFWSEPQDEDTEIEAPSTDPGEDRDLYAAPGEVDCDLCPEPRLRALKSCLLCLMSYCESHLQPHLTNPRLKRHQLIHPLPKLEEHICPEHQRPLELFCRDHSHFMCMQCSYTEGTKHDTVFLKEQGEEQEATLKKQIKDRREKVQEIQRSLEQSQRKADAEMQEGLGVFTALMECVQESADSFKQSIVEKHLEVEVEASRLIRLLQIEICKLRERETEMEQLWISGDHLSFVQIFTTVKPAPRLLDWSEKTVRIPSYKGTGAQAVSELRSQLNSEIEPFLKAEIEKVQEFAVEVSLDPDTADSGLVLSEDLKQVRRDEIQYPLFNPFFAFVLGKQKFSSGKFYFEVQVKGKTEWRVGVAKESVDREYFESRTVQNGYWTLYMFSDHYYETSDVSPVVLSVLSCPEKVGVFVDYDEGRVSFYDADKKYLIYSFTDCRFNDNILPLLHPSSNDTVPLVLTPVES